MPAFRWENCVMNALGDSLTHGDISGTGEDGIPWTSYMAEFAGLRECRNFGINGNQLTGGGGMADRCGGMPEDADLVCVFGGMNDFCRGIPLGTFGSDDLSTVYGALHTLAGGLYRKYPGTRIFIITPPKCRSTLHDWEAFTPNAAGLIERDYRDAILRVADYYSMPVLDLYTFGGMSCYLDTGRYRPDGLHYSNAGYRRLAQIIASFINHTLA